MLYQIVVAGGFNLAPGRLAWECVSQGEEIRAGMLEEKCKKLNMFCNSSL